MAHALYTPEQAAESLLAATRYKTALARIVHQDASREFKSGYGDTVSVRRPVIVDPARTYTRAMRAAETPIEYSDLLQSRVPVTLANQVYNAVKLPDDFATFTLANLEAEVIAPMAESVAQALETMVAEELSNLPEGLSAADTADKGAYVDVDGTAHADVNAYRAADRGLSRFAGIGVGMSAAEADKFTAALSPADETGVFEAIAAAHQVLGKRGVPLDNRVLVVGADWEAALLGSELLKQVSTAGADDTLRRATIGQIYGFTVIVSYSIDADAAVAMHRDAVALATRTTAAPRGASFSAHIAADGFTLRYLQDYDSTILTDRAVVDTFAGTGVLDSQRAVSLRLGTA